LFRCVGIERVGARELLELARGDVALAVAVASEALGAAIPAGLPQWSARLAHILQQLATPDSCIYLLQCAEPGKDFNSTPIEDIQTKQITHCHIVAISFVQFNTFDRALHAAEGPAHRHVILSELLRAAHSLAGSRGHFEPGRLISRCFAFDFMRLGFRFLAPFVRKLIDTSAGAEAGRLLRHTCRALSWLLVHSELDGNLLLANSLKPLVSEWTLRSASRGTPAASLAVLFMLAGNAGALEDLHSFTEAEGQVQEQLQGILRRRCAMTSVCQSSLEARGYSIPSPEELGEEPWDEDYEAGGDDCEWWTEGWDCGTLEDGESPANGAVIPCHNCCVLSSLGRWGEGSFDGLWYCQCCWDKWDEVLVDQDLHKLVLGLWWPAYGEEGSPDSDALVEQTGAAKLLGLAPSNLRCGISGGLLVAGAVRIPGCAAAAHPVAFTRQNLERWHRRSGGRCPITLEPLDMRSVQDAPDVADSVRSWLQSQGSRIA